MEGYTKQQDDGEEAEGWHVVTNGDEVREGWQEVKEVGLVEALQEVIQLTIHSLQQPGGCPQIAIQRLTKPAGTILFVVTVPKRRLRPADGGGVSLVLTEAVDALDGGRLNVVSKEKAVIPPRSPAGLLHHHHHQGLDGMTVSRRAVPVVPLQLRKQQREFKGYRSPAGVPTEPRHRPLPFPGWCTGFQSFGRKHRTGWLNPGWGAVR